MTEPRQNTTNAVRVLILLALSLAATMVTAMATFVATAMGTTMMWSIVIQDVLVFILPAVLLAVICYKNPWRFLEVDRAPSLAAVVLVVSVWAVSLPALNWIVDWNQNVHLPSSMAAWEQRMRDTEAALEQLVQPLLATNTFGEMLLAFVVVGVMAGVSEEFFFRGALMGILRRGRANIHWVVWIVAIVFSAIHFQFLGFVPRMLLGAWFGYLLVWTRSLWVPILAHTLNNGMVVVFNWMDNNQWIDGDALEQLGVPSNGELPWLALASAVATAAVITLGYRFLQKRGLSSHKPNAE